MEGNSRNYINTLLEAYEEWFGAPSEVLRLRQELSQQEPAEIGVVIYLPESSPDGSTRTLLCTAGMSMKEMNGPVRLAELGIEIEGTLASSSPEIVAKQLAELAWVPFRTGKGYRLNSILEPIGAPVRPI